MLNGTWKLTELLKGHKAIESRWVLKKLIVSELSLENCLSHIIQNLVEKYGLEEGKGERTNNSRKSLKSR